MQAGTVGLIEVSISVIMRGLVLSGLVAQILLVIARQRSLAVCDPQHRTMSPATVWLLLPTLTLPFVYWAKIMDVRRPLDATAAGINT